jgi:hypothetical protein
VSQTQRTSRECAITVSSACRSQQRTSDWIRQGQITRNGNHGHQIESEGVVTHPQSQARTEQVAWLTVQLRDQHTTDQGIPAIPTAKVMGGRICISTHTPCMSCSKVDFSVYDSFTLT